MNIMKIMRCFCIVAGAAALSGCMSIDAKARSASLDASEIQPAASEYRLKPGDRLGLVFMPNVSKDMKSEYRLDIGDEIHVKVHEREDLSGAHKVAPDGWIQFPLLGPIQVKEMTLRELSLTLTQKYKSLVAFPQVAVGLNQFNSKATSFMTSLASQSNVQGSAYETSIGLDGIAFFPQIGAVELKGKTLRGANEILRGLYDAILPTIDVTTRLNGARENVVTVLGEVKHPGSFEVSGSISLIAALGLAEGWISSAHLETLLVVQQREGELYVNKYNMEKDLVVATQIQLTAGDMVFVPRSAISDINVFVDQFLRRNIPINIGVGIPIN